MKWRKGRSEKDEEQFAFEDSPTETYDTPQVDDPLPMEEERAPVSKRRRWSRQDEESPKPDDIIQTEEERAPVSKRRRRSMQDEEESPKEVGRLSRLTRSKELSWLRGHWKTIAVLLFIFSMALFVRGYYGLEPATEDGFILSGGSDSYYHNAVITDILNTGKHRFWDNMLQYPIGSRNPRPPLYDWSVGLGGIALSPFFENVEASMFYVFLFSTAFWGSLTIFPVYFLAKEAFGRKTGIVAAFLLAIMPGHIQRSVLSNADHDAMALFFIVTAFYFFLRALKLLEQRKWVDNWWSFTSIRKGLKDVISSNRVSILYAVMAALSITGVGLIWKGYAYAIVILTAYFGVQVLINRFRNSDSLAILMVFLVTAGVALLLLFPYYYQSIQIQSWYDAPVVMFIVVSVFALIIIVTNRYPWLLVFASMIMIGLAAILVLYFVSPALLDTIKNALMSGAGYFVSNKQYQTIAEAQAPPFSNLALSFGMITFWLSFVGVGWAAAQLPKKMKADFIFILIWMALSIYMAVTAARFMFNAGPAFALTAGWVVAIILEKLDIRKYAEQFKRYSHPKLSRGFSLGILGAIALLVIVAIGLSSEFDLALGVLVIGLSAITGAFLMNLIAETNPKRMYHLVSILIPTGGAIFYLYAALGTEWEMTPATHGFILFIMIFVYLLLYLTVRRTKFSFTAGVLFLAFFIVVPNVWAGLDAGIPFETKKEYDQEWYDMMPIFLQPDDYENKSNWFMGGFGYSLPLNSRYWPATYDWLATQDVEIYPSEDKPAFLSWWDYGFEIINEGKHPTVADNFLGGHRLAGNFIMAQSEEDAIGLLITVILKGNWQGRVKYGEEARFDDEVKDIITSYGINLNKVEDMLANPANYIDTIKAHPEIYGPRDDVIQNENARILSIRGLITETLEEEAVASMYHDLREHTGHSIRYFGIDSRMFPFSAQSTGIFYAPAKLSDHRINPIGNQPYDFWEIVAVDEFGGEYPLDDIPMDVSLNPDNPYKIKYKDMFYNSMLYKCFIGYSAEDIGQDPESGIPGLFGERASDPILPGWNMTHFRLVHRTAYWNPYPAEEIQNHTDAWQAMNIDDALAYKETGEGISDTSDRSSLYQGVMMLKYYDGAIISGTVTLEDGTPVHGARITISDDFGIPHDMVYTDEDGSYSAIAPFGDVTITTSVGALNPMTLIGPEMNITSMIIEDYQAMRENEDRDSDGKPDYLIDLNPIIGSGNLSGTVFWDKDGNDEMSPDEESISNAELRLNNKDLKMNAIGQTNESGMFAMELLTPGTHDVEIYLAGRLLGTFDATVTSQGSNSATFGVTPTTLTGRITYSDGSPAWGATVTAQIPGEDILLTTQTDEGGNFTFETLLYGTYNFQATLDGYASAITRGEITQVGNNTMDLGIYPSSHITGTVALADGTPIPTLNLRFTGPVDTLALTDEYGNYSLHLVNGQYELVCEYTIGSENYISVMELDVNSDVEIDVSLASGSKIYGTVQLSSGLTARNVEVIFENVSTGAQLSAHTNNQGMYTLTIPQGQYLVQVSTFLNEDQWTYYSSGSFTSSSAELDMTLSQAELVLGTINWDMEQIGAEMRVPLEDATISFIDTSDNTYSAHTDQNGSFGARLRPDTNYQVYISKPGFISKSLGIMTTKELTTTGIQETLIALPFPVSGTILIDGQPIENQTIMLDFTGESTGAQSQSVQIHRDGTYSLELMPGKYTATFTHNTAPDGSTVIQIADDLTFFTDFYTGTPLMLDMEARRRMRTYVSVLSPSPVVSNVAFKDGPESRNFVCENGSGEFYVMPGTYVLVASYAFNETLWVGMASVNLSLSNNTASVSIEDGFSLHGLLAFKGDKKPYQQVVFREVETGGTLSVYSNEDAEYEIVLAPNRTYVITVDFIDFDPQNGAYYRYFANSTILINAQTTPSYPVSLQREDYYTNVSGEVTRNGVGAALSELVFLSDWGSAEVVADDLGHYSLQLRPGNYSVYVHHEPSHDVYLGLREMGVDYSYENFTLTQGYKISGTTYYNLNQHQPTLLTFASISTKVNTNSDSNGFYQVWLPPDTYNVTGECEAVDHGINVTYVLNVTVKLEQDKLMNLPMSLVQEASMEIFWNDAQRRTIYAGEKTTYTVRVTNTGNMLDTYGIFISGRSAGWNTTFDEEEVLTTEATLYPGASQSFVVNIETPTYAKVYDEPLTFKVSSQSHPGLEELAYMPLDIWQNYGADIEQSYESPVFDHGEIIWEFHGKNTGNGEDVYDYYIANKEELLSNGWTAELGEVPEGVLFSNDTRLLNVTVVPTQVEKIPIILRPTGDSPSKSATVLIAGYSHGDSSVYTTEYITLRYPELDVYSANITVVGEGIYEQPTGNQAANAGVMAVTVAAALVLFYVARKKRWLR